MPSLVLDMVFLITQIRQCVNRRAVCAVSSLSMTIGAAFQPQNGIPDSALQRSRFIAESVCGGFPAEVAVGIEDGHSVWCEVKRLLFPQTPSLINRRNNLSKTDRQIGYRMSKIKRFLCRFQYVADRGIVAGENITVTGQAMFCTGSNPGCNIPHIYEIIPPFTATGSFPARKDSSILVMLPFPLSPGPMMPVGNTTLAFNPRFAASKTRAVAMALLFA